VIDSLTDATVASRCRATVTQSERDELRRMVFGTNRHNDVLPALAHVGHRRTDRAGRQLGFPDHLAGRLVVRLELLAPCPRRLRRPDDGVAALADEQQVFVTSGAGRFGTPSGESVLTFANIALVRPLTSTQNLAILRANASPCSGGRG
jgi:hypothetical protein